MTKPIEKAVTLNDVSFTYGGNSDGLRHISLAIVKGECLVLTGRSGNGKTTLTRLINGTAPSFYDGELRIFGRTSEKIESWENAKLTGTVFQDPKSQFFSSDITGEIAFAAENYGCPTLNIRRNVNRIINEMNLSGLKETTVDRLSSGEKQKVAIAAVKILAPSIFVFDEPSANLDPGATEMLGNLMRTLKEDGHTLIIAEHRTAYLEDIADRYVYLEHGKITADYTRRQFLLLSEQERQELGLRSSDTVTIPNLLSHSEPQKAFLRLSGIECGYKKKLLFENLSSSFHRGTITAVTGYNGQGKTSLAKIICGLKKESSGRVYFGNKHVPARKRNKYVWFSSNDTNTQLFTSSVEEELLLLIKKDQSKIDEARNLLRKLQLHDFKDRHPVTLSGGQKLRLSIACGLLSDRPVMIFDEPTSGLDGEGMRLVAETFKTAANNEKCIIIISHDAELIRECCTHHIAL